MSINGVSTNYYSTVYANANVPKSNELVFHRKFLENLKA